MPAPVYAKTSHGSPGLQYLIFTVDTCLRTNLQGLVVFLYFEPSGNYSNCTQPELKPAVFEVFLQASERERAQ